MILLDTNVISELLRRSPDPAVVAWFDRQPGDSIWTTVLSLYELKRGPSACHSVGDGRILPVDEAAAEEAARLSVRRLSNGLNVDLADTLIAGVAQSRRATLATRNLRHFPDLETPVVNPWDA